MCQRLKAAQSQVFTPIRLQAASLPAGRGASGGKTCRPHPHQAI
ncbi:Uncharacterized protein ChrSV_2470 [Chromobacterium vaccinii]|nr:Uncharacterized protein ChrSV_2470 [Chromobacterium vaccinii]